MRLAVSIRPPFGNCSTQNNGPYSFFLSEYGCHIARALTAIDSLSILINPFYWNQSHLVATFVNSAPVVRSLVWRLFSLRAIYLLTNQPL